MITLYTEESYIYLGISATMDFYNRYYPDRYVSVNIFIPVDNKLLDVFASMTVSDIGYTAEFQNKALEILEQSQGKYCYCYDGLPFQEVNDIIVKSLQEKNHTSV